MVLNLSLVPTISSNNLVKKLWMIMLLYCFIPDRQCEPHSLRYYYSGMSRQGQMEDFQATTNVDDQQVKTCNKKEIQHNGVTSWMKDREDDSYWEEEQTPIKEWHKAFYENLLLLRHRYKNTNDLLILQLWYGCEIEEDGDIRVHYEYGFQGRDYSLFDTFRIAWDPIMQTAQDIDERKTVKRDLKESVKSYLTYICPMILNKYIANCRDKLESKVPPKVEIFPIKGTERLIKLQCLAYGFYPRAVDVKWVRNGVDHVPSEEISPILPHPDGTYQKKVSLEMPKGEGDTYSCHVDHSSLKEEMISLWDPKQNNYWKWMPFWGFLGSLVVCVVFILVLIRFCKVSQKGDGDSSSTSSASRASSAQLLEEIVGHQT